MLIADHETAVDFLNYEFISKTIVKLLKNNQKQPLTIGIHGDWGAGKSSVLRMIESEINKDGKVACLWFNGWIFQGFDDAKTVLIEETINELCRRQSDSQKIKKLAKRLIKSVDLLKMAKRISTTALTLGTGIPFSHLIEDSTDDQKPTEDFHVTEQIHQFRKDFCEFLDEAGIDQLVVLIDDLDRCLPKTAVDTLEAIRLFLFVPHTAFVIGADETMIEYSVRQHFPELTTTSGPMSYARNYLEKLIQVPFRIPTLGIQETKTYVTLLLIESLVGENHEGFHKLLKKTKEGLNKPWLWTGLKQSDVEKINPRIKDDLRETYVVAQQIGPILAEGSKGNPRQIKRFLNTIIIREMIATARGFNDLINRAVLAKLMLAEQFQPKLYEHIVKPAMIATDGKSKEVKQLEGEAKEGNKQIDSKKKKNGEENGHELLEKFASQFSLDSEWVKRWLGIEPMLSRIDLRPYVFAAREKRIIASVPELDELEELIKKLCGPEMVIRGVETKIVKLSDSDTDHIFATIREYVLRQGSFQKQPSGFHGMSIIAKHHPRFQTDLLNILDNIDTSDLGIWVVTGWNEILTEIGAQEQLRKLLKKWMNQEGNTLLKEAARQALGSLTKGEI